MDDDYMSDPKFYLQAATAMSIGAMALVAGGAAADLVAGKLAVADLPRLLGAGCLVIEATICTSALLVAELVTGAALDTQTKMPP